jgi:hypothetical protein
LGFARRAGADTETDGSVGASRDAMRVENTNPIDVSCQAPVAISPPLAGSGWWDANGCCSVVSPHRGATLPVNGDFKLPEQFAIDYVRLNARGGCCTGPVKQLSSWPFFGAPILAVADGVVEGRVTGTANRTNDTYEAGGNLTVEHDTPTTQTNRMPTEGQVFGYNLK